MNKILKGGIIVSPKGLKRADVLINGEKIVGIGKNVKDQNAEVIDVKGKYLFPGFIDAHTHFDLEVSNTVTADGFESGSKSAIKGGTTTIIDFATQNKGETLEEALNNWHVKAYGKTSCDYAFHMAISDWKDEIKEELPAMFEQGVTSFKVYMTYPAMILSDEEIFSVLTELKKLGGIVGVHCENAGIIDALIKEKKEKGELSTSSHPKTRPDIAEAEAINRLLSIAKVVDVPVVVVHLSTKKGFEVIKKARAEGQKVYIETCPQYLLLDDSRYDLPDFEGAKYECAPPLRKKEDNKCLWEALKKNEVDTISTDHCSFTMEQKRAGIDDFTKIPNGMPGVETRGELIYSYGVAKKRITLQQMCKYLSENPAKLYGLFPRKGIIAVGSDADIVVYDPKKDTVISAENHMSACDYSPFEGVKTSGSVDKVLLRGNVIYEDGKIVRENRGIYLPRENSNL